VRRGQLPTLCCDEAVYLANDDYGDSSEAGGLVGESQKQYFEHIAFIRLSENSINIIIVNLAGDAHIYIAVIQSPSQTPR
jgi:hypothetical protein